MSTRLVIEFALYFLALINPASKVFMLSSVDPPYSKRKLFSVSLRSTLAALLILFVLTALGQFLLAKVFRIDIYSLKVAGGTVLFLIGLTAVQKGRFFEQARTPEAADISIVPLGAPMIAGPGTITAAISLATEYGAMLTLAALCIALAANFAIMLMSLWLGKALDRVHATGPLIWITGLIVAAVAVQMMLAGLGEWLHAVWPAG